MRKISRRKFLKYGALGGAALLLSGAGAGIASQTVFEEEAPATPVPVDRFRAALPIPPVLQPVSADETTDYYEIVQREGRMEILPGLATTIWGYNGIFPGPTIKARVGRRVVVKQTNDLDTHTVVHLHGGVTPQEHDGFPMDMVHPGETREYVYPNGGHGAATQWYHDHAMDHTGRNVYMGLAGMYLLKDAADDGLALPSGEYDVPLMITNRLFAKDGKLVYSHDDHFGAEGDTVLVNGAPWPRMEVAARKYRFRILNASNATLYTLALDSGRPFTQIGTDGGLMDRPVEVESIPLGMAERAEVVIDFSAYPVGSQIVLRSLSGREGHGEDPEIMRFDVVREEPDDSSVPEKLREIEPIPESEAVRTREFVFGPSPALKAPPPLKMTINGEEFDPDRVDAAPGYGDVEIWRLVNKKMPVVPFDPPHPVHIHLGDFQVLDRNGEEPPPHERGWKDTVTISGDDVVRIIKRFDGYKGKFIMHCHNLEHEDHFMMARFDVV